MILSTGATANGPLVHADGAHGKQTVAADLVVHAAGREPDLDVLDLTAAQVRVSKNRLELNEYLQSVSNPLDDRFHETCIMEPMV
jgi:glutathione reductase (NADPH)